MKLFLRRFSVFCICILIVLVSGCTYRNNKEFIGVNPTSYIFEVEINELKQTIIKLFGDSEFRVKHKFPLVLNEKYDSTVIFLKQKKDVYEHEDSYYLIGRNDFILEPSFFWRSEVYVFSYFNETPAIMTGVFLIKLKAIDNSRTEVAVLPISFKAKTFPFFQSIHGVIPITQNVKPTGIEEYAFIYYIGCYMGLDMPEIKRPNSLRFSCNKIRRQ